MGGVTRRALVVPALLLALTACNGGTGGGEGGGTTTADDVEPTPSYEEVREAYVTDATQVCEQADADFSALEMPTTPDGFGPYVAETVTIAERAESELSELEPPERDRAELEDRVLDPFAALVEDARAYSERVEAAGGDQAQLLALLAERPTAEGIDLDHLRSYGLEACADAISQAG